MRPIAVLLCIGCGATSVATPHPSATAAEVATSSFDAVPEARSAETVAPRTSPCVGDGWRAALDRAEAAYRAERDAPPADVSFTARASALVWYVDRRDPDAVAAVVLEALRRDQSPAAADAFARFFVDFEEEGLGPECREEAEGAFRRLVQSCDTTSEGSVGGLVVRVPLALERARACRQVACARCRRALAGVDRTFDGALHDPRAAPEVLARAADAYEALAFGPDAPCPASLHVAQMAVRYAGWSGDRARRDALAARVDARFPVSVTYLVHRDIVSYGGPPDPCRIDERAFGVSYSNHRRRPVRR